MLRFFRDPAREVPDDPQAVLSPADGRIVAVEKVRDPYLDREALKISVFMNVFNVHVNRSPIDATISAIHYRPGKFLNASLDKASDENERQLIKITMPDGKAIGVVQIAGLVARRILCDLKEGQSVRTGERFGIIRFGSRVDVYLPVGTTPLVIEGQRAVGGETIIADLKSNEDERVGNKH